MSKKETQKGFSLIEGLLVVIALTLIGFVGWYVWNANHKDDSPTKTSQTTSPKTETATKAEADPTKDWTAFTSKDNSFSVRYPTTWFTGGNPEFCDASNLLLLGSTKDVAGKCASDSVGQVLIASSDGDNRSGYALDSDYYKDITSQTVTVDGVAGTKSSGTYTYTGEGIGPTVGTKQVNYVFYSNGKTYVAQYSQAPSYPDALSDFNLVVTKTLNFN
jgi:hypothetical protein